MPQADAIRAERARASYDCFERVTIRFSDQDPLGHVNNVAYAAYFEAGRFAYLRSLMAGFEMEALNCVLARVEIDYLHELRFPGVVEVGGRLLKVGRRSVVTGYGAFVDGECCAVSTSVNVFFDPAARVATDPPEALRAALLARMAD